MQSQNAPQNQKNNEQISKIVNIATMVRIRPLLQNQKDFKQIIKCKDQNSLQINLSGQIRKQKVEKVFSPESTQKQIFKSVQPIINKCSSGYNVTIFTYGQTGSGKTHTMFGSDWNNIIKKPFDSPNGKIQKKNLQQTFLRSIEQDQNHSGLIPRSIHHLFNNLITKKKKFIKVYCSFLQLYNQTMIDLLEEDPKAAKQKKMFIHQNEKDGIYIQGLNQILVEDADQCLQWMKKGQRNRIVRQTSMNIKSSRSHTIFQLLIQQVFPAKKTYRRMKLNLCDLAGSQKINKTQRMENDHLQELKNINLSLTSLGKVISSLSQKSKPPYRQSKLTRLLQDSLGGNTYTAIIATITTKSNCLDQSINTLKFLQRAKQIKSQIISRQIINDNPQMKNLQKQIAYLKDILKLKRTGANVIDVNLSQKYQRLQKQNMKLKQLVDQELIQKLTKQNRQLKIKLQRKNNDDLSQNLRQSNFFNSPNSQKYSPNKEYKTIQQPRANGQVNSNKDQENRSQYRSSSFSSELKKKNFETKSQMNVSSTNDSSTHQQIKTKLSMFPSVGKRVSNLSGANKILDRIQQIQKAKQINKLKLQKQLQMMSNSNSHKQIISIDSRQTFARVSKYSSKYRY